MITLEQWRQQIPASLAEFMPLTEQGSGIDFIYGILTTAVLWPVRQPVQEYDVDATTITREIVGKDAQHLLKLIGNLPADPAAAARVVAKASRDASARATFDILLDRFDALQLFAEQLALQLNEKHQLPEGATYNIDKEIKAALVTIGGITNIGQLTVRLGIDTSAQPLLSKPQRHVVAVGGGVMLLSGLIVIAQFLWPVFVAQKPYVMSPANFNVAIADFGEIKNATNGRMLRSSDGETLADKLFEYTEGFLKTVPELQDDVKLQHEHMGIISGSDYRERRVAAAQLAQQINADIIIYGYLDTSAQPKLVPEYYISSRLTGADEVAGEDAFGAPIDLELPLAGNAARLRMELLPRFEALTNFIWGLAFLKARDYDFALQYLDSAQKVEGWPDDQGKEILYLWLGTTLSGRALVNSIDVDKQCPITLPADIQPDVEESYLQGDWACAWKAYKKAIYLNSQFARAYSGLGYIWSFQAVQRRGEQPNDEEPDIDCSRYERALDEYDIALRHMESGPQVSFTDLRIYYSIGQIYTVALSRNCNLKGLTRSTMYKEAEKSLLRAVDAYDFYRKQADMFLIRNLGARSHYQYGLANLEVKDYNNAIDAFRKVIIIASPVEEEEDWQTIRWNAYNQIGYAYSELARAGDTGYWGDVIAAYEFVINNYKENKINPGETVGDAYYFAGEAYEAVGNLEKAKAYYAEALKMKGVSKNIIQRICSKLNNC